MQISDTSKPGNQKQVQLNNTNGKNEYTDNSTTAPSSKVVNNYYPPKNKVQRHFTASEIKKIIDFIPSKNYPVLIVPNGINAQDLQEPDSLAKELQSKLIAKGYTQVGIFTIIQSYMLKTPSKFVLDTNTNFAGSIKGELNFKKIIVDICRKKIKNKI